MAWRRSWNRQERPIGNPNLATPTTAYPLDLATELRAACHTRGLSPSRAARLAGISKPYLSRLARGLRAPRPAVAGRLAVVLTLDDATAEWPANEAARAVVHRPST